MDVGADMINRWVPETLGLAFRAVANHDLRPTQSVATVAAVGSWLGQLDTTWGIKPEWATSQLVNAKCETVRTKQALVEAYVERRCLVPCSGFYEWRAELNGKKKHRFSAINQRPLYMAAFWYPGETPQIVTLTRDAPSLGTRAIHTRSPVFIRAQDAEQYVLGSADEADEVLGAVGDSGIEVTPAQPD
ncbi:SOS response-associated peptidase family protein [Marinimicrobium agarilyticum]|uniref:SOS response-associated peptidase family protein n=1 Tax=Marinimicrobium agarilyticum TaxID=306546 RepID=UPI003CCC25EC